MALKSKILCVIPARGGSKGIPKKNIIDFGGKPLLAWSIEAALNCKLLDKVIVSTENAEIAQIARAYGAEVPFLRSIELAGDDVHAVHVVLDVLEWLENNEKYFPDAVVMLLPTSPLRTSEDILNAINIYYGMKAKAVISVSDLAKYLTNLRYLNGNKLEKVESGGAQNLQRQGLKKLYAVNGSIFMISRLALIEAGSFHIEGALAYVMDYSRSVDINDYPDLSLAKIFLNKTISE